MWYYMALWIKINLRWKELLPSFESYNTFLWKSGCFLNYKILIIYRESSIINVCVLPSWFVKFTSDTSFLEIKECKCSLSFLCSISYFISLLPVSTVITISLKYMLWQIVFSKIAHNNILHSIRYSHVAV